ncbi:ArsR family transcriptional regulator [Marinitoga sp. 1197]|uniref:ArsR/SmtB family transcription factor n=1 Tax=Marinitoga sp. 1197 TaxID=1428449 RepID=UPI000657BA8F|nr:metalloregulator ArsR/SmtB family transcription factor [Marinitoga sp. 1197]KLO21539.1 ArsR family transcriptional regulator [Marinitoga sp. 1197]
MEQLMKILAEKTRLRILNLLYKKPRCVCELTAILELPQSTISRHISKMKLINLLIPQKEMLFTTYRINDEFFNKYSFFRFLLNDLNIEFNDDIEKSKHVSIINGKCIIQNK